VPWRFSDAGLSGARTVCVCRHPKTCTARDIAALAEILLVGKSGTTIALF
jgi:hypothetical protein